MWYPLVRRILFTLPPEAAHQVTLKLLAYAPRVFFPKAVNDPVQCMGLTFPNRIGIAAGFDKNAECIDGIAKLGFGFIEVGTLTPRPQVGRAKPRIFRSPEHQALINRMGFPNRGIVYACKRIAKSRYQGVLGINIGKNADTPIDDAVSDYLICMRHAYPHASYLTINISSPNTEKLRTLQEADYLSRFLETLKEEQQRLQTKHGSYKPLVLKIAPDLTTDEIIEIAELIKQYEFDGVIATNTTLKRHDYLPEAFTREAGGLSGVPLAERSTAVIRTLAKVLPQSIPIIGCGGIVSQDDAKAKLDAGATLLQTYTGLIYQGPNLVAECASLSNR